MSDLGSRRCGFKPLVRFMACDSENKEIFNILWQQIINVDISQLILWWKDGDVATTKLLTAALCDWGKVC